MIIDQKTQNADPGPAVPERKLSIELSTSARHVYTAGAPVVGIVRLGKQDVDAKTVEVQVSVVCLVRTVHHKYYGGTTHDIRRETSKLIHCDETLWKSSDAEPSLPPYDLPFSITIPGMGYDKKAKDSVVTLPPSFHAGRRRGWRNFGAHASPIGFVKYYVKIVVVRKGTFTLNSRAFRPFIYLPPSPPPPLLPSLPDNTSDLPGNLWTHVDANAPLRHNLFSKTGNAVLQLYLPRVPLLPRLARIPFVLCLVITTETGETPTIDLTKASLYLQKTIHAQARGGKQTHVHILDGEPTDNILYGLVPLEDIQSAPSKKRYTWRGMWMCRETPSFVNRQLSCQYALVGEVPIKGLGNGVKLVSEPIEICSGVTFGVDTDHSSPEDAEDLPPDYFDLDGLMDDDGVDEKV